MVSRTLLRIRLAAATFTNADFVGTTTTTVSFAASGSARIELNENWTIPQISGTASKRSGSFGEERGLGKTRDDAVQPGANTRQWGGGLTVEGARKFK